MNQLAVGPGGMERVTLEERTVADVDAAEGKPGSRAPVQLAVHSDQRRKPWTVDWAVDDPDQVDIAYPRHVVAVRQRASDEQVTHPAQARQTIRQTGHRSWHLSHRESLRTRH
ncbi:MAG TPA: hypothetical protein VFJ09_07515 [Nocardioidaceae bacterium]|nr:hypothetical protein [Nocardioidaceae bacterium]